jgi:hypothetical protein
MKGLMHLCKGFAVVLSNVFPVITVKWYVPIDVLPLSNMSAVACYH